MKTKKNYYKINYLKANGTNGTFNVKAINEKDAIANAKDNCFTGSGFFVEKQIEPTKDTIKGGGSHRMNS